jgi:hypothetical protein
MNPVHYDWPTESPPRRRWGKRLLWGGLSLLVVLVVGTYVRVKVSQYNAEKELDAVIAELDETDPHWRLADIEAARKVVPDDENTALIIMRIAARLPKNSMLAGNQRKHWSDRLSESGPDAELEPDIYAEIRAEVKGFEPLVNEARGLARLKDGRYPITYSQDFIGTLVQCQDTREVVYWLQKDLLIRLREKDSDGALECAQASAVVARSIGDEPVLVSQLVRMACDGITVSYIERVLAQGQASEPALARLQDLLEDEAATSFFLIGLRGERGGYEALMRALEEGKASLSQIAGSRSNASNPLEGMWESFTISSSAWSAHPVILRKLTKFIELAQLPPEQQVGQFQIEENTLKDKDTPALARLLIPGAAKIAEADIRTRATLRCALVAVAAERFRLAQGRWPKDSTELVPAYLKQVPLDPYDGQPIRLRAVADGLAIYSVGPDRQDNGGKMDRRMPLNPGNDLVFRLWNVEERRKPALNPDVGPPQPTEEERQQLEAEAQAARWMPPMNFAPPKVEEKQLPK